MTPPPIQPSASPPPSAPLWADLAQEWARYAQEWSGWWARTVLPHPPAQADLSAAPTELAVDPAEAAAITERYAERMRELWQAAMAAGAGAMPSLVEPKPGDRRFEAEAWRQLPWFALLKQGYLLYADYLRELASASRLPPGDKRRLAFLTRQFVDAVAPTNFAATNPEVLEEVARTEGGRTRSR
jgi:polyhydroxyalkanoate synthase